MKIKEIAKITRGYSNRLNESDSGNYLEFLGSSYRTRNEYTSGKFTLRQETISKLLINENMVLFSPLETIKALEFGRDHVGKLVGRNMWALEFADKTYMEWFYYMHKFSKLNYKNEGTIIKTARISDILDIELKVNEKTLKSLKALDKYNDLLIDTQIKVDKLMKGLLHKEKNGKDT